METTETNHLSEDEKEALWNYYKVNVGYTGKAAIIIIVSFLCAGCVFMFFYNYLINLIFLPSSNAVKIAKLLWPFLDFVVAGTITAKIVWSTLKKDYRDYLKNTDIDELLKKAKRGSCINFD